MRINWGHLKVDDFSKAVQVACEHLLGNTADTMFVRVAWFTMKAHID